MKVRRSTKWLASPITCHRRVRSCIQESVGRRRHSHGISWTSGLFRRFSLTCLAMGENRLLYPPSGSSRKP
jgi:hypothetical protein